MAIVQSDGSFFVDNVSKMLSYTSYKNNWYIRTLKPVRKQEGFNEIIALNSSSQFIKDDLFLQAVQLFSIVLRVRSCYGKYNPVHSLKGADLESR